MRNKHQNISIGFQLSKITTEQFAIIPDAYNKENPKIEMSIGVKFGLNREDKMIASFVTVSFEQRKKAFMIIEIANHFKIEDNAWNSFNKSEREIIIPKGFAIHLVMLTVGTLRGTLHCKTENTEFNSFILPTINVTELVKEDIVLT